MTALGAVLRQHGHESLVEGAFGKQAAQEIGDLERQEKGVGAIARPEHACEHHVPGQPEHAGHHGHAAGHGTGAQQAAAGTRALLWRWVLGAGFHIVQTDLKMSGGGSVCGGGSELGREVSLAPDVSSGLRLLVCGP